MSPFSAKGSAFQNGLLIEFSGPVDEHADFSIVQVGQEVPLTFDLEKVTRINSLGIRTWMVWFAKNAAGRSLTFRSCPKIVVDQFNMVANFLPKSAVVESFFVPYFCETCSHEQAVLLQAGTDYLQATASSPPTFNLPPTPVCEKCSVAMDLDVNQNAYFRFLKLT